MDDVIENRIAVRTDHMDVRNVKGDAWYTMPVKMKNPEQYGACPQATTQSKCCTYFPEEGDFGPEMCKFYKGSYYSSVLCSSAKRLSGVEK